jgi:succinate dehydrogenase/fumarate reductase-like Fe-S protein
MEIPMSKKLTIRAFFFNAKTDYLPYYKNFTLKVEDDATAKELLGLIQEQNSDFSYPKQKLIMKINGLIIEAKEKVASIVERLGTELTIEPASSYRSNNGLKINDDDFMQSYALLEPYATESDLKYYKTLYALHYASETSLFDREYIGDAILVLAHKMISEGNTHKHAILEAISSVHSGLFDCEYENNLFNAQSYDAAITALKDMAKKDENEHPSLMELIKNRLGIEKEEKVVVKTKRAAKKVDDIENKYIAYYAGVKRDNEDVISQIIADLGAKEVTIARKNKLSGLSILEDNKTLALKKAGATLLEAYDAGAEVLVVENEACYEMFVTYFKEIENVVGRKIIGLELLSAEDFAAQVSTVNA